MNTPAADLRTASERRVALITGASRGIGAATAGLAATRGYDLFLTYNHARKQAEAVAELARRAGARVVLHQAEMADGQAVERIFSAFDQAFGRLDAVVNNAGITGPLKPLLKLERAELEQVFDVNVVACFIVAREAVRRMSTANGGKGGAIVNVSSRAAQLGGANEWVHYAASKGAIDTFTVGLAREAGALGVRVNAVSPGLIETEIHAAAGAPDRLQKLMSGVPLGRSGTAEEVAESVLWLLSEAASYVSGTNILVSGGR